MMKRRVFLRHAAILAGAAAAGGLQGAALADTFGPVPLFAQTLPDPDGTAIALSRWQGKPVVVNFWASWCPPCVKEMPDFEALHKKYPSVQFLGIGVDTASNIRSFVQKVRVSYPLLVAGHEGIQLMRDLGNQAGGLPFTVVFDAKGREVKRVLGQIKTKEFEQVVQGLSA